MHGCAHWQAECPAALADFDPDASSDELADMMGFDVEGDQQSARFLIEAN